MRFSKLVQELKQVSRPEWLAASALAASLFSVGFSLSVAACNVKKTEPAQAEPPTSQKVGSQASDPSAPPKSLSLPEVLNEPDPPSRVPSQRATAPAPVASNASPSLPPAERSAATAATPLAVKRFVVASAIEAREPVVAEKLSLANRPPVFAFAELENPGVDAQKIRITFEQQGVSSGKIVGNVELAVPPSRSRWRTWAKTQLIDKPGAWAAVLRDEQGQVLARTPFEVTL